ncbi:hypothetical protein [Luteolibacter luteus]|uniref:Uncharacterized protein n=1 Tax=Luteolibacter luteus TaxID=2728835 RepID=A0A858RJZ6_9BACT|nr:hypothetical protein [Luteolibacter luteus]QJE97606.1 hypothetical protein HHL09_18095 [Luteolibacter luteus]
MRLFHQASSEGSEDPFADPTAPEKIQVVHGFNLVELKNPESFHDMELLRDVISDPESLVPFPPEQDTKGGLRDFGNPEVLSWDSGGQSVYALFSYQRGEIAFVSDTASLIYGVSKPAYKKLTKTLFHTALDSPPIPEKAATLEEAKPSLQLLGATKKIYLHEGLPKEGTAAFDDAVRDGTARELGRFYFYQPYRDPGIDEKESATLKELLLDGDTLHPWEGEKECEGFHPDYAVRWGNDENPAVLQICLGCGEAILLQSNKELRYDLGLKAQEDFKKLLPVVNRGLNRTLREIWAAVDMEREKTVPGYKKLVDKATPVSASSRWRESLREGAAIKIHEGVPRMMSSWAFDEEMKRHDVTTIAGHGFYAPAINAKKADALREVIADAKTYEKFVSEKECGGFHPDFGVSWKSGDELVHALFCYGCGEAIFTNGKITVRHDLDFEAIRQLYPLFGAYASKRPAPFTPDDPEEILSFQKALKNGAEITVMAGLPREDDPSHGEESKRGDVRKIANEWFYQPGSPAANPDELRRILTDESLTNSFAGKKGGSYFHGDYAVSWMENGERVDLIICLDPPELIFSRGNQELYYGLSMSFEDDLKKALEPHRKTK